MRRVIAASASACAALALSLGCSLARGDTPAPEADATAAPGEPLARLPRYRPARPMSGRLRIFGSDLNGTMAAWERGFQVFQPAVQFDNRFVSSDAGIAGLVAGVADLAPQAREPTWVEQQWFAAVRGHAPYAVTVATGAYDREGMADGLVIWVNRANPLTGLTVQQLARIFGSSGTGADTRRWGQLGLSGQWANAPIRTYGYAPSGMSNFFQLRVLGGSDQWNPGYREYVESGTKMIADDDVSGRGGLRAMLIDELSRDPYGVAMGVLPQAHGVDGIRVLPLSSRPGSPFVLPTPRSFRDHSYPLSRSIYIYLDAAPGAERALTREFLLYILSREGQSVLGATGTYLPLDRVLVQAQRRRLRAG
jgi:phosphate transport system substrate-binding protein